MSRTNFGARSGIIVDVCREHGSWFDRGELDATLQFIRDGGMEEETPASDQQAVRDRETLLRAAEAALRVEALQEGHAVEKAADLIGVLFGGRQTRRRD
jgi:Zn-finger nucleic acid-binding protein